MRDNCKQEIEMERASGDARDTMNNVNNNSIMINYGRCQRTEEILNDRAFDWKQFERARLISPTDCNLIIKYEQINYNQNNINNDNINNEEKIKIMESNDGILIINAFVDILRNCSREDAIERAIANLSDLMKSKDLKLQRIIMRLIEPEVNKQVTLSNITSYRALLRVVVNKKMRWFSREKASVILCQMLKQSMSFRSESVRAFDDDNDNVTNNNGSVTISEEMQTARTVVRWSMDLLNGGDGNVSPALLQPWSEEEEISSSNNNNNNNNNNGKRNVQQEGEDRIIPTAIHALASVLQHRKIRPLARNLDAYKLIAPLLDADQYNPNSRVQVLYEAALCAWLLSFDAKARKQALKLDNAVIVRKLINVAKTATKEKVVRVAIMALKNILIGSADAEDDSKVKGTTTTTTLENKASKNNNNEEENDEDDDELGPCAETAIERDSLRKVCENLAHRGFEDYELVNNLEQLTKGLAKRRVVASSWERYLTEVRSGSLDWSPSHTDEGFWRNECSKLTDNNCFVLRNLIAMMSSRDLDARTLAVACHDVGEFATHYPSGRFLACDLGAKTAAMALMIHSHEEVKAKSLICVQKLLVANWKFIGDDRTK